MHYPTSKRLRIWSQWVLANATSELLGLGLTFAAGFMIFSLFGEPSGSREALLVGLLMTATGLIEGTIIGILQWAVLRKILAELSWKRWVMATLVGALIAWSLGSIPSTLASMQVSTQSAAVEPPQLIVFLLASAMGAVLGVVLALPQWNTLRRWISNAWIWIPANSLAWLVGMPVIFFAVDLALKLSSTAGAVLVFALALFISGAVVGSIHGQALIRFEFKINEAIPTQP